MIRQNKTLGLVFSFLILLLFVPARAATETPMNDMPVVKLRTLDKVTARTVTFEASVGATVKFGKFYIKIQTCRKAPPIEQPEAAAFLQIWQVTQEKKAEWVFSGWMFASSPGLSSIDHPVYDVWVLDCLPEKTGSISSEQDRKEPGEGEVEEQAIPAKPDEAR